VTFCAEYNPINFKGSFWWVITGSNRGPAD
jgi:hypothetical protein